MTEEPWNKHTPGDPMPCKCAESMMPSDSKSQDTAPAAVCNSPA